jgi:polyisoprenoid-binding protein YceI
MGKNIRYLIAVSVLVLGAVLSPKLYADEYTVDPAHSSVGFTTTHLMVSRVSGQFDKFEGTVNYDPSNLDASKVDMKVETSSVDTHNEKRDTHLKSPDFFDAEKFPAITFVSKKIAKEGDKYTITGDLTIKDVTKEVTLPATIAGPVNGPMGGPIIGITATGKINRQDYGVKWNKTLDSGGVMVSDDVDINVSLEAHKKENKENTEKALENKETK